MTKLRWWWTKTFSLLFWGRPAREWCSHEYPPGRYGWSYPSAPIPPAHREDRACRLIEILETDRGYNLWHYEGSEELYPCSELPCRLIRILR